VGPDGATHQALEEISLMSILPNMRVVVPCDSMETEKATRYSLLELDGPAYIRFAREATPVVTSAETPYKFGVANIIRYRGDRPHFRNAFETFLAGDYAGEEEDLSIIACGPMVAEAMRAAWLLKEEYHLETRVVNVHTVKPLDAAALARAADETQVVLTAEEHQVGGFGNIVAGAILRHRRNFGAPLVLDMVGVEDRFGISGKPWELMQWFGLCAENLAGRALELLKRRQPRQARVTAA
jgi:transketolase